MRRFRQTVRLGVDHATAYTVLSSPSSFLGLLDVFRELRVGEGRASALLPVTIHGVSRTLRLEFDHEAEPPSRVTYTGRGDARIRIRVDIKPAGEAVEAFFEVEVSAHTLTEPVVSALLLRALRTLNDRLGEKRVPGAPVMPPVGEGLPSIDALSERLADPLFLGELLLSSKYLGAAAESLDRAEERVRRVSAGRGETLYVVVAAENRTLRLLARRGAILAATYETATELLKGAEALAKAREEKGVKAHIRMFTVEPKLAEKLLGKPGSPGA